jgi:uncharacterized RDD family membrane protein YckC
MRCPKCQYISFDSGERCRNCGYDFSLSVDVEPVELPIQAGTEAEGPLSDFSLNDAGAPTESEEEDEEETDARLGSISQTAAAGPGARPITSSFDLPLFKERAAKDDAPLVTPGAPPRAPLAVRRTSVAPTKPRQRRDDPNPQLALETAELPIAPERLEPTQAGAEEIAPSHGAAGNLASPISRLGAATVDGLILGTIDATVLYFTLKICELPFAQVRALPLAPFGAFLLLMNGAYFAAFVAAGGQTIGKMAAGIRVVHGDSAADTIDRVSLGHAIVRAAGYLISALPAGLGFLPALFGDRRALHDRLADTRVVKA